MNLQHGFSFDGGNELSKMGATWFITYAYAEKINSSEKRWMNVKTHSSRASMYDRTRRYHRAWYSEVLEMSDDNLNKNTIGVTPYETKRMAQELIKISKEK